MIDVWKAAHRTAVVRPKCLSYKLRNGKQICTKRIPYCHRIGERYTSSHWGIWHRWTDTTPKPVVVLEGYPRAVNP